MMHPAVQQKTIATVDKAALYDSGIHERRSVLLALTCWFEDEPYGDWPRAH